MVKNKLVNQSIDYIIQHLEAGISIEDVADYCHLSKYYFCRIFKEQTGESIYAFIKRLKVEQSAFRLKVEKDKSITNIGYDFGYSPSNYSSLFKNHNNISPAEFRKGNYTECIPNPFLKDKHASFQSFEEYDSKVLIKEFEDLVVVYERFIGNYLELPINWREFIEKYKEYMNKDTLLIERSYADPSVSNIEQCVYDICMTVSKNYSFDNVTTIKKGKYAVYIFEGVVQDIFKAFQGLFNVWLAGSSYEMDERYGLGIYRTIDWENMSVVMELCIPIIDKRY